VRNRSRQYPFLVGALLAGIAPPAAHSITLPGQECSGSAVSLSTSFDNVTTVCVGLASIRAAAGSGLINQSDVSLLSPAITFDPGFSVESGSRLIAGNILAPPDVSINSTSQNPAELGIDPAALGRVWEQPFTIGSNYRILASNDLGMHCGDLDTRIASILPPFNVLHAQVLQWEQLPQPLSPADGIEVRYSAASNPADPALSLIPTLSPNGAPYKTNFWSIAREAFDAFYPSGVLSAFYPNQLEIFDLGLPVPDIEGFYLGPDGVPGNGDEVPLTLEQQAMPAMTVFDTDPITTPLYQPALLLSDPFIANQPQHFRAFIGTLPFFTGFPFGYTAEVNWYEAAGIPVAAFDDFGRENAYPLMRVQAFDAADALLASLDTVVPISAEADCQGCHAAPVDGGNGAATQPLLDAGVPLALSIDDPAMGTLPLAVSIEYASDINILRLHDLKHGSGQPGGPDYTPDLENQAPVVCQRCHYTPALDLAQVGPSADNGREQLNNKTMSNVMHNHHGQFTNLFPLMPPADDPQRIASQDLFPVNDFERQILEQTCYRCHPGEKTACLRGAMFNAGILCQDCHGNMEQVGNDFSQDKPGGPFIVAADFYTNPATPRVPWANEPGCGSCHTGDAMDNLAGQADVIPESGTSPIRLIQAYRVNDPKATPIVPSNKRFAETVVASGTAAGNPKLYRVSSGHGGLFCQACHGSTHAVWPNANPNANDNVAADQLQQHAGSVAECDTCHDPEAFENGGALDLTMDGPHGLHALGSPNWNESHKERAAGPVGSDTCRACHGPSGDGSALSRMTEDRVLQCKETTTFCPDGSSQLFPKGHEVTCYDCHENEL